MALTQFLSFEFFNPPSHCVMGLLLQNGAEINSKNASGKSPLFVAIENGDLLMVEFLLQNGADANDPTMLQDTPLHFASRLEHFKIVEALLKFGARNDLKNSLGRTPLEESVFENGSYNEVIALLK